MDEDDNGKFRIERVNTFKMTRSGPKLAMQVNNLTLFVDKTVYSLTNEHPWYACSIVVEWNERGFRPGEPPEDFGMNETLPPDTGFKIDTGFEDEHATARSRRLPTILSFTSESPRLGTETRTLGAVQQLHNAYWGEEGWGMHYAA